MSENADGSRDRRSPWSDMARYSHLGLQLAVSIVLFLWVGWWLDGRVGTVPLFTVLGALTGAAAGFYSLYYHLVIEPRSRNQSSEPTEGRE